MVMLSSFSPSRLRPAPQPDFSFVSAVLEGFAAGVLILAQDGTCLHHNHQGQRLCRRLCPAAPPQGDTHALLPVPPKVWAMGHHLIEGRAIFPDHALVLSQDLMDGDGQSIQVRVQWLDWPATEDSYLVVLLDDPTQTAEAMARIEALRYNLTPREREVWVLRQANQSYEAIAQALYISVNTVKRHLKSIYAKRKQVLDDQGLEA